MPTSTPPVLRILRVAFAALAAVAVAAADAAAVRTTGSVGNLLSYFTIESNVLAVLVLAVGGIAAPAGPPSAWIRGLATLAMVVTGVVSSTRRRSPGGRSG